MGEGLTCNSLAREVGGAVGRVGESPGRVLSLQPTREAGKFGLFLEATRSALASWAEAKLAKHKSEII